MLDPRDPGSAQAVAALMQARKLIDSDGLHEAEVICRRLLAQDPELPDALYLLALIAVRAHAHDEAETLFRQAIAKRRHPMFYRDLARSLTAAGREDDGLRCVEEGLASVPNHIDLLAYRGQLLSVLGRKAEALEAMGRVLALAPKHAPHFSIATLKIYQSDDPHLRLMEELLAREDLDEAQRAQLCFGAAYAWDQMGDYERAFELLAEGNRGRHEAVGFDVAEEERNLRKIVGTFTPEVFERIGRVGVDDATPVLIVGMPRSGTTLVEQILSSHPSVQAVGEIMDLPLVARRVLLPALGDGGQLPEDVEQVPTEAWSEAASTYLRGIRTRGGEADRIVDKQLFNDTLLGIFHLMFPRGRAIHCLREPMDNCLSCFRANFERDRGYVYDQYTLGRTYRLHEALMAYWKATLPEGTILTVRYEDMVDDVEAGARRLIEFMDLPWDDACLRFHESERAVRTLSQSQVRRPIYRSSLGRWRHYEQHLGPLQAALADPVDLHSDLTADTGSDARHA
jgi:tetratricopeptide (TPR) repeat protein